MPARPGPTIRSVPVEWHPEQPLSLNAFSPSTALPAGVAVGAADSPPPHAASRATATSSMGSRYRHIMAGVYTPVLDFSEVGRFRWTRVVGELG